VSAGSRQARRYRTTPQIAFLTSLHDIVNHRTVDTNRLQVIEESAENTSYHHRDTEGTEETSKCSARLFNDDAVE